MNLDEKRRLRRIVDANARAYRAKRGSIALSVAMGNDTEASRAEAKKDLVWHAHQIAEAAAALTQHADDDRP